MKSRKCFVSNSSSSSFIILTEKTASKVRQDIIDIFALKYKVSGFIKYKELSEEFDDFPLTIEDGLDEKNTVEIYDYEDNGMPDEIITLIQEIYQYRGGRGYDIEEIKNI